MQFAKSTDYALHALVHLANSEREYKIGIKELSDYARRIGELFVKNYDQVTERWDCKSCPWSKRRI